MAEKLTPQQAQAVQNRGGKLLISAAAGSGKTKVLVDRLMLYLTDPIHPANIDEFLIITYTKAAASELRGKIAAKLTERIAQDPTNRHLQRQLQRLYLTKISTVHAFCSDLLREYAYRIDLSADFRVADENECRELRETVLQELLDDAYNNSIDDEDFRAFIDTQGLGRTDRLVPDLIQKVYDSARCHLAPEEWLDQCIYQANVEDISDAGETIWGQYLMEDLFASLDGHILAIQGCVDALYAADGMEKPSALLSDTLFQLNRLRSANSWDEVVKYKELDYGRLTFPRKCTNEELAEQVKAVRTACKKAMDKKLKAFSDPSSLVLEDIAVSQASIRGLIHLVREFSKCYDRAKYMRRVLDFGDLEHKTLDLLLGKSRSGPTQAALETGKRFREIMVDEYQDSNGVQDAIFGALTKEKQNLFMVGDVKQSIYQFRLADPRIFLDKYNRYAPAENAEYGQGRKILLSSNFRSGGAVLSAVNDVFCACMSQKVGGLNYGEAEALREGIPHQSLGEPEVELQVLEIQEHTYPEEAAFVAQRISELLDGSHYVRQGDTLRPITADDVVILLRSPGSVGRYYQQALESLGIRCTSGGGTDLLQSSEIQTLRSLLQVISNPRQDIPLIATLSSPVFGFTADDLAAIRAGTKKYPFYDSMLRSGTEKANAFVQTLASLRKEAQMHTLSHLIGSIYEHTNLDRIYASMADGETKAANLHAFYQLVSDFETTSRRDLSQFLEHLDILDEKGMPISGEQCTGAVTIMSIHKSKGLEFPVVFLCGLSREFNRESLRAQVLCDQELGLGLSCVDVKYRVRYPGISKKAIMVKTTSDSISEELRVLYVAMTRAKDRLIMVYSAKNPELDVSNIALRMDLTPSEIMNADVGCPGDWVLYAALKRTEAGALHRLGGRPKDTFSSNSPWLIRVGTAPDITNTVSKDLSEKMGMPTEAEEAIRQSLAFRYPFLPATHTPSKQTATELKGRQKDQEAAANAQETKRHNRPWRQPTFLGNQTDSLAYGNAIHAVMQFIPYEKCADIVAISQEIQQLADSGFITPEQAAMADAGKINAFFQTEFGRKLRSGENVLREFKFSVLVDAEQYQYDLPGEKILLQGVVDCALIEDDGITVVDFKTDRVTDQTLDRLTQRYAPQVKAYADALSRIFERRIKGAYLYFFDMNQYAKV